MSGEQVMRRVAEGLQNADLRPLFEAIDDAVVWKSGATAPGMFAFGGTYQNRIGVLDVISHVSHEYVFRRFQPLEIIESGNVVWGLFDVAGEHLRSGETPRVSRPFQMELAVRWRMRGDKVIEHQAFFDTESLLRQLSTDPPPQVPLGG